MIQLGTLLQNRYRIGAQIGKGGMGEVYIATDQRFQSTVAIKRTFYNDLEMRKAFEREARLLNRLRHPALPKVSDYFSEGGGQFLVMEFIDGSDLSELLMQRKIPFSLADVLRWADDLLDALDYLHTQQPPVVHRDIKPHNIKLTSAGKVLLLDFGLAKAMLGQTTSHTAQSIHGYSLNFAPLEQIQGTGTDPRSDLYSLAATLYYLLTATHPPDAVTRAAAIIKHQPDPLRPAHMVQPQVPLAVSQILQRAMAQDSALRHESAVELRAELRQATSEPSILPGEMVMTSEVQPLQSAAQFHTQSIQTLEPFGPIEPSVQFQSVVTTVVERPHPEIPSRAPYPASSSSGRAINRVDSQRQSRLSDSFTVLASPASRTRSTGRKKSFAIMACLLVVCAATVAYLLANASGSDAPAARANTEAQSSVPSQQPIVPTERMQPDTTPATSDSSHMGDASNLSLQSSTERVAGNTQSSANSQAVAKGSEAQSQTGTSAKSAGSTLDGAKENTAGASSTDKSGLVIQNPAPAVNPADEARRAEAAKQEQPAPRPEYQDQPPPGGPYPPPPGNRPPPPPPDGRRPPPGFRPPYR